MIGNTIKTTFFLTFLAVIFIALGRFFGGTTGMIIGFGIALLLNGGSYWFSDKIVLKMHKAKEAPKDSKLYQIVEELAKKAKLPMPKVYYIESSSPNAFATGRSPKYAAVASTRSLISILSDEELKAVMAHELSHVKHRDTLIQAIAVTIASSIAFLAEMLQWMAIFGFGGDDENPGVGLVGTLAIVILAPIIATVIQLAISRQREYLADAGAVRLLKTPMPLISALQKLESAAKGHHPKNTRATVESLYIVNPFKGSVIRSLFSTHPPTQKRIEAMKRVKFTR